MSGWRLRQPELDEIWRNTDSIERAQVLYIPTLRNVGEGKPDFSISIPMRSPKHFSHTPLESVGLTRDPKQSHTGLVISERVRL